MKGYCGKILMVDLTKSTFEEIEIPDAIYENFLSGVGLGAYILYKYIPKNAAPLGPDNILGFISGLLTGTGSFMTGRWMVVTKSPLTGGFGDANCGGNLSPSIKHCGYDGIFFKGKSKNPVFLFIDNKGPQLIDASKLWGQDTVDTEEQIRTMIPHKKSLSIATIGMAGENQSLISGISHDGGRMAARSGVGAVMGSKNLKALVLCGSRLIKSQNPEVIKTISQAYAKKVKASNLPGMATGAFLPIMGKSMVATDKAIPLDGMMSTAIMKKWGTGFGNTMNMPMGDSPVKNWKGSVLDFPFSKYRNMNPDRVQKHEIKKYHCYSCVIGCGGICDIDKVTNGRFPLTHKPEYETVAAFGALLLNKDLDTIFLVNELLNRGGMDSISAGNTIAFAMECYEKGWLSQTATGGLDLTWGNAQTIITLVEQMIAGTGFGAVLQHGVKKASEILGIATDSFAIHAGGQEPGMHDPRLDPILGIHYSCDPTPGRHTIGAGSYYTYMRLWESVTWAPKVKLGEDKKEEYEASSQVGLKSMANACIKQVLDGSGGCLFGMIGGLNHFKIFDYLNAATGWDKTADDYMSIGLRMQTLRQCFNVREGINPRDFKMNDRLSGFPPLTKGPLRGKSFSMKDMMSIHYQFMGWDRNTGIPTKQLLEELGFCDLDMEVINHG
ncbi:aldehyde ferredoxin oxidoreductase family protein [Acetobacterium bakii]|uniref:aldehyde ferredoxin oxidoreductase family protein n=1 Tax=Acetobacterium bakii TaxID=52689 RepID=UPI000680AF27|nr:aldehyde ferredoxin oxidoreductase family protein [Acetobacterium bakii]